MRVFVSILCLFSFFVGPRGLAGQMLTTIEIAIGEWKPFVTEYQDGYGETTELVTVILERMGYRPRYNFMPWGRAVTLVARNGKDTGPRVTFPFIKSDERRRTFFFSAKPILKSCIRFFYNKNKISRSQAVSVGTVDDVADFRIAYVSQTGGYQYPSDLAKVLENDHNTACNSLYEAFKQLVDPDQSVQVVPSVAEVGEELLYELFPEQRFSIAVIEETPPGSPDSCLLPTRYYLLTSKRNPNNAEFMRKFDREHNQIEMETGETIARIRRKASERPTARTPEVILDAGDSPENIRCRDDRGDVYHLPRGTRGLLLEWRLPSRQKSVVAKVRIISGPYRGKVLLVEGKYIKLI